MNPALTDGFTMSSANNSHLISDEESLDDHSGLEDFQSVTLQMNDDPYDDNEREPISRKSPVTTATSEIISASSHALRGSTTPTEKAAFLSCDRSFSGATTLEDVPRISITPMTPPSASISPDGHSTVSLDSSGGSPLFQNQKYRGQMSMSPNLYWRPQSPMPPKNEYEAKEFFAYRDSIVQTVMDELQTLAVSDLDGHFHGSWLLTDWAVTIPISAGKNSESPNEKIDHWDNEKERIVLMCEKSMIVVKYDFIAMKQEDYRRIYLCTIDKIVQGELKYPERSLAPRLNGIAGGIVGVMKDCIIPTVHDTVHTVGSAVLHKSIKIHSSTSEESTDHPIPSVIEDSPSHEGDIKSPKTSLMAALSLGKFEPRARNVQGMRVMWNQNLPLSFTQKWNPFNKSIPWITFASHPLLWHKGGGGGIHQSFDIDSFSRELMDILSHGGGDSSPMCRIEYKPIIIETYLGLASLFHNANSLGFYKVRGKVSF